MFTQNQQMKDRQTRIHNWRNDWDAGRQFEFAQIKQNFELGRPYIERLNSMDKIQTIQFLHFIRASGYGLSWHGTKLVMMGDKALEAPAKQGIGQTWGHQTAPVKN
jgi:hypothetical protein